MKLSANWLKDFVKVAPPLEKVAEDLTLAGLEVKKMEPTADGKDMLLEIEITPNRPDWLSHFGVAREISAVQNLSLKQLDLPKPANRPMPQGWKINLKDLEACPYYTGVYIEGIQNLATPDFIKDRLLACGLRPIHIVVDITNYVLFEMGQPLHAFDADLILGQEIQIRRAKPDEKFLSINGQELTLAPTDLVIADVEKATAVAGVMGGKDSEVSGRTRNIFLESAFFLPRFVRQTSRRLGLSSDSSYRFERRVDPEGVDLGRERAITLIQQYAKPRFISAVIKAGQKPVSSKNILHLSVSEVAKKLGTSLKSHQIASILTRLGFDAKQDSTDNVKVIVPSFRGDITENIDLIEELARIHGFDQIPETLPSRPVLLAKQTPLFKLQDAARHYFSAAGCFETVTFSLISGDGLQPERDLKHAVYIHNPQNQELCWMRPFFLPSLLQVIEKNLSWGAPRIPIFELANLYRQGSDKLPHEEYSLGIALTGNYREKSWGDSNRDYLFYDLKGLLQGFLSKNGISNATFTGAQNPLYLNPGYETLQIAGKTVGGLGEVDPKFSKHWGIDQPVFAAEISLELLAEAVQWKKTYAEVPRYPAMERDLSVQVPDTVTAEVIRQDILGRGQKLLVHVEVFDLFRGGRVPKGHKNLAYRLVYQSPERTLISEEVQKLHTEIAAEIAKKYGASFQ